MDLDWCLSCERAIHHDQDSPYCSTDCHARAGPSLIPNHPLPVHTNPDSDHRWTGNDCAGILAWAAQIPPGPPVEPMTPMRTLTPPPPPPPPAPRTLRPPNLLNPHRKLAPPALSRAGPATTQSQPLAPPQPTTPIVVSSQRKFSQALARSIKDASVSKTSLKSEATESSIATPVSSQAVPVLSTKNSSFLAPIYSHVRSWMLHPSSLVPAKSDLHSSNFPIHHHQPHGSLDDPALASPFPRCRPRALPTPIPRGRSAYRPIA